MVLSLNPAVVPAITQLARLYQEWTIDGTVFDAGVGMLMSCRGVSSGCLMVYLRPPFEHEKESFQLFTQYADFSGKPVELPAGLKIWIHEDIVADIENQREEFGVGGIDFVIINLNATPPLFYAQIN
jgi:hypothetical protein